ncbi:hypothetical protein L596_000902 [Steinernema carpocapsae]|uniref:Uncharacterized protein n=1 Tax=Steinernema carpocapsae TaxID=34508 RepID=A0A4U8UK19_STECR|nr:hypothetical protein L596_000902 [Steinernema carpocapsae]
MYGFDIFHVLLLFEEPLKPEEKLSFDNERFDTFTPRKNRGQTQGDVGPEWTRYEALAKDVIRSIGSLNESTSTCESLSSPRP